MKWRIGWLVLTLVLGVIGRKVIVPGYLETWRWLLGWAFVIGSYEASKLALGCDWYREPSR